ncbi:MAG: hypothetical protein AABX14_03560 [Candidatus Aenigmatarchaeota archaeon]
MVNIYEADFTLHPSEDNGKKQRRLRPVIMLQFQYAEEKPIDIPALIDSGADQSVSFQDIGEILGIKFQGEPTSPVNGITGESNAWEKPVSVKIGNECILINVFWINRNFDKDSDYMMALGREKIFDTFDISFTRSKKIIFSK